MIQIYLLILTNIISAACAIYLYRKYKQLKDKPKSREMQDFVSDLLAGKAIVQMRIINAEDLVLRSPSR